MNKDIKVLIDDGKQIKLGTGIGKMSLYLYQAMKEQAYNVSLVSQNIASSGRMKDRISYLKQINSKEYAECLSNIHELCHASQEEQKYTLCSRDP
mgnify:CR=1 FL=1